MKSLRSLLLFLLSILSIHLSLCLDVIDDDFNVDTGPSQIIPLQRWPVSAGSDATKRVNIGELRLQSSAKRGSYLRKTGVTESNEEELYRVGMVTNGEWVGCLVKGKDLKDGLSIDITLSLSEDGNPWNVGYDARKAIGVRQGEEDKAIVTITTSTPGPSPLLNRPVVLTAEGKMPEQLQEKSFLQKYWWIIVAGMVLVLAGGGDK